MGLYNPPEVVPLRETIPLPQLPLSEGIVAAHAACYPALRMLSPRWDVRMMFPWQLVFVDRVCFDFKLRGSKVHMLVVYDLVTGGVRVRPSRSKAEDGIEFDKIITMESLDRRPYKVTVATDNCGAMTLVADAAQARHLDYLPLVPHQPHLNVVEGIVASFKADVAACLLNACVDGGPIHEGFIHYAAEHVAYNLQ